MPCQRLLSGYRAEAGMCSMVWLMLSKLRWISPFAGHPFDPDGDSLVAVLEFHERPSPR